MNCLLERMIVSHMFSEYGGSITIFSYFYNCTLSWLWWILSTSLHPVSFKVRLILPSHLWIGLPSGVLLSGFYIFFLDSVMHATCLLLSHDLLSTQIILTEVYSWSSHNATFFSLCYYLPLMSSIYIYYFYIQALCIKPCIPSLGLSALWILTKKLFQSSQAFKITHFFFHMSVENKWMWLSDMTLTYWHTQNSVSTVP
jgi:hypothetical protein